MEVISKFSDVIKKSQVLSKHSKKYAKYSDAFLLDDSDGTKFGKVGKSKKSSKDKKDEDKSKSSDLKKKEDKKIPDKKHDDKKHENNTKWFLCLF